MRRLLLVPLLALPLLATVPAHAGCDENGCYPSDCLPYNPQRPSVHDVLQDPTRAVTWLLPPVCPT
ncbi:MAG TPA: hypothetical protein VFQ85_11485 [Mycobacteriales bacterium]|jgi:hypothetical protein|nr:hypothetical protein [Mycobacteriales bacterium]